MKKNTEEAADKTNEWAKDAKKEAEKQAEIAGDKANELGKDIKEGAE
jgi:hypothetical protein